VESVQADSFAEAFGSRREEGKIRWYDVGLTGCEAANFESLAALAAEK